VEEEAWYVTRVKEEVPEDKMKPNNWSILPSQTEGDTDG
jgi:hypothetical protein